MAERLLIHGLGNGKGYSISVHTVPNGEFREIIESGDYQDIINAMQKVDEAWLFIKPLYRGVSTDRMLVLEDARECRLGY